MPEEVMMPTALSALWLVLAPASKLTASCCAHPRVNSRRDAAMSTKALKSIVYLSLNAVGCKVPVAHPFGII